MRPVAVLAIALGGVAVIGGLDHVTGTEVRVFPLYFLPVALVAWRISRTAAVAVSAVSGLVWMTANSLAGRDYTHDSIWLVNSLTQSIAFATVGVLVAELQRRLRLERGLSRLDALTGLPNRRAFCERSEILFGLARRARRPITLAYLDLDHFKEVNDRRGHQAGDVVLQRTADAIRQACRTTDLVARLAGDEFAILLPDTGPDAAAIALERVRAAVAAAMAAAGEPCTASLGAAAYLRAPATVEAALHDADGVMYRAKAGGKDRVIVEPIDPPISDRAIPSMPAGPAAG